ncbi:MAG: hypothetical protein L3J44_00455 [Campylobacteraceae bacterium]|nr:hypothetical protein [Campylobacteraceae bacterium]
MIIKKTSTLEFYKIELKEIESKRRDLLSFIHDFNEYSDGSSDIIKNYSLVFNYIKNTIDKVNVREIIIRNKKHKLWIDSILDDLNYIYFFSSRENQNGAVIDKSTFDITLAQDEKLDIELASLSHFVIDKENNILALEKFDGSTSKTSLIEYFNSFFKETNIRFNLYPIPRDDLEQVLSDVKSILSFKAKYRDIKEVMPDFLETHIFSKSRDTKLAITNPKFTTKIDISFGSGEEIDSNDTIITKLKRKLFPKKEEPNIDEEDDLLDGRIEIVTNYGSEEVIKLQENLLIEKLQISINDTITKRADFSNHIYEMIVNKIKNLVDKRKE